jgi:hypothetical protein
MTPLVSRFEHIELDSSKRIDSLASRYLEIRSEIVGGVENLLSADNPAFTSITGFSPEILIEIIRKNAKPTRIPKEKRKPFNDIYRSDLGELLMVDYFEKECCSDARDRYIIPIKNLWDRELDNSPGRGFDAIGYKSSKGKHTLLLGEAKVSGDLKSPPPVVDQTTDSIYNNHSRSKSDVRYLEQRISNYVKKVGVEHKGILSAVLLSLAMGFHDKYEIVYGCCLVRDNTCYNDTDYGKMKTDEKTFLPGIVHFIIYSFDKTLSEIVELFYDKIETA